MGSGAACGPRSPGAGARRMINIISRQPLVGDASRPTGPYKVFANLLKGLEHIGHPYVVNRRVTAAPRLWVHDWPEACQQTLRSKAHVAFLLTPITEATWR